MEFWSAFPYDLRTMNKILAALVASLFISSADAEDRPYIPVGSAKTKKTILAMPNIVSKGSGDKSAPAKTIFETITNDLTFIDLFKFLDSGAFIEDTKTAGLLANQFKMSDWTSIGTEILVKSAISTEGSNIIFEAYVYDTFGAKQILAKRYVGAQRDVTTIGHSFSNDLVEALTGLPGIFLTKIAMSCDRTGRKEIYLMDFDGTNVKQVTHHNSIAFAPAWHPSGTKLAYSLYTRHRGNIKNIDLYEYDFNTNSYRMLSNRTGINSGAFFSPDGKTIALTMSFLGNPEIFLFNPSNSTVTRVTHSFGFDVDPAFGPDGKEMAFVSSRTGMPMVFKMNLDGTGVKRLTFAGRYNATPNWSPQGNKMVFAGDIDKHFDIFLMNPDGTNIERLTKNQGNNEDPYFSPDGNFVTFSSNRTGQRNIYVMNVDGTFVKRLTFGLGNCVTPKWSNPPGGLKPIKAIPAPSAGTPAKSGT